MNYRYFVSSSYGEVYKYKQLKSAIKRAYSLAGWGMFGVFHDAQTSTIFTHIDPLCAWYEGMQP